MEFKFNINPDGIDEVFDERGNSILKISEMSWNDRAYKIELRKWVVQSDGSMTPNKGFSFLTDQGPHDLTHILLEKGYGDNQKIKEIMESRGVVDLNVPINEKEVKEDSQDFYDPEALLGE